MAHLKFPKPARIYLMTIIVIGVLLALPNMATATPSARFGVITVEADHAKLHRLSRNAATIIVGNPAIADVTVQGGRLLIITGKNYGTTNLIALDKRGIEIGYYKLYVKTNGIHKLTVQKAGARISYTCAPRCEREIQVGDNPTISTDTLKTIDAKAKLAKETAK